MILPVAALILSGICALAWLIAPWLSLALGLAALVLFGFMLHFFRNPPRTLPLADEHLIYAPADGQVCVIEEVYEPEYFQDKRLQVSIFMSPLNVHVNRNPIGGDIVYVRYHPGSYLVAWHPKSSTENERSSVVYRNTQGEILLRQVAGAVARRICCYVKTGDTVQQGAEMGFIKFGSRVDLYLPLHTKLQVQLNDMVTGKLTVIGSW